MAIEKFVGSWTLKQWTAELADERIVYPFGKDPKGRLTYDSHGRMAVQIMKTDRPTLISEDPLQARPEEVMDAYAGFIAYCGTYEVHLEADRVVHTIAISSFPNWVGQDQIRNFEFHGDNLTLSTDPIGGSRHKLVWSKMPDP